MDLKELNELFDSSKDDATIIKNQYTGKASDFYEMAEALDKSGGDFKVVSYNIKKRTINITEIRYEQRFRNYVTELCRIHGFSLNMNETVHPNRAALNLAFKDK